MSSSISEEILLKMRDSMIYRGPDDGGIWIDGSKSIGLAHRRLSIIDPTPSGHQPMRDKRTGNMISYNGEVYNYIEIRAELKKMGYIFSTGTDTEVILAAYDAYGEDCVRHFNGMFAFVIWDSKKKHLFMARDRLGIKPFYYHLSDAGDFHFASEVKAIRLALEYKPRLNLELIDQYMSFGYIPGSQTLEHGIQRLLPGHTAVLQNGNLRFAKYWDLDFSVSEDRGLEYYVSKSKELLNSAIDLRLRSDVPLGIFLSGGIDSSAVVGLLAQRATERLKTFSVAYDFGRQFDETPFARMVAEHFNTDHHELFLTPSQFMNFIPDFSYLMDEPVTEAAAISLQFISKLTSDHVTVVLSGEGSDEIFAGYDLYRYMSLIERYRRIVGPGGVELINRFGGALLPGNSRINRYLDLSTRELSERYKGISTYDERMKELLYRPEFKQSLYSGTKFEVEGFLQSLFESTANADSVSRMLYFDTKTWLVDDLLIKADRMSMAASLELRVPFLDYRLVEFAATIPTHYKIRNGEGKFVLKKMMEGILPEPIIKRKKMGFPTPLKLMFQGEMADYARARLLSDETRLYEYFKSSVIRSMLDDHISGRQDYHRVIWQLLVLEEWLTRREVAYQ